MMKNTIKVMTIFGTRPEAIKMAPLALELQKHEKIESIVCVTAQHRQMLDQVLEAFKITPKYDLNIMKDNQTLSDVTSLALCGLEDIIKKEKPNIVLVHGDTTTTLAGSLAAFYNKVPVGHVEAGLRTFDKYSPYPEEMNRRLTGVIADMHFVPTMNNKMNLINEGIFAGSIYITGNTVIDALKTTVKEKYDFEDEVFKGIDFDNKKVIIMTAHRRENLGDPLENICHAVREIAQEYEDVLFVYPVHLNPAVKEPVYRLLGDISNIILTEPVSADDLHNAIDRSYMVLTDSGGLQEEAPSLGKPVLVMRRETERPEAVDAGTVVLAGIDKDNIKALIKKLLTDKNEYERMAQAANPYGDGQASKRIVEAIIEKFSLA